MMILTPDIIKMLASYNINITGAFHIGAHDCEELEIYHKLNIQNENIVWIEAIPSKVSSAIEKGIQNVYNAVITDKDDEQVTLNVSNNVQSSSVLEFGTHATEHPHIVYVDKLYQQSITIDTFMERNNIDARKHNFWNLDIQGAELMALKGATKSIQHAKALYLEVNETEVYKGCGLMPDIDAFLLQYQFKRVLTFMTRHGWGDALYIYVGN